MNSSMEIREGHDVACDFSRALEILRDLPLLSGAPLEGIKVLAYLAVVETYAPGEALLEQGEKMESSFFLLDGEVEIFRRWEGKEAPLYPRGKGAFFGGLGLLAPTKALFSVRAVTDVRCLVLAREKFLKTAERFPDMLPRILGNVVEHVFRWEETFVRAHAEECADRSAEMGLSLF